MWRDMYMFVDSPARQLQWTLQVEVMMALEEKFEITFEDENAEQISTVGDAVKLITAQACPHTRMIARRWHSSSLLCSDLCASGAGWLPVSTMDGLRVPLWHLLLTVYIACGLVDAQVVLDWHPHC